MRNKFFFVLFMFLYNCSLFAISIPLEGKWRFQLDTANVGIEEAWFQKKLSDKILLPGSLQEQGYGLDIDEKTAWTGLIVDKSWFTNPRYDKYREKGNVKVPFWLNPEKHYVGVAWYQKEFRLPKDWEYSAVILELERTHWETTLYVDGIKIGDNNALSVPHRYVLPRLKQGKHTITIRVDNRVNIPVGVNAHSVSDHTQSNWNGIVGAISLRKKTDVHIGDIQIYPDIKKKQALINISFEGGGDSRETLLQVEAFNQQGESVSVPIKQKLRIKNGEKHTCVLSLNSDVELWSEFTPTIYTLKATLQMSGTLDEQTVDFGLREFKANGTRFEVNGIPIFLRGTLECCVFPLTGYPSTEEDYWRKIYTTCKSYGLNHVRFHSWCPPEAAFRVADQLGIYLQVECGGWAEIGNGGSQDRWFYEESDRILKEYGNHPSFCMMAYGNEPSGNNQVKYLSDLVAYWKKKDNRRVYTSSGGWPYLQKADYWNAPDPRIQGWGEGLKSRINAKSPTTDYDFWNIIKKDMPTVSHEIGQWCAYPDFKEIEKYTGVLKARNFEIFKETLTDNNMSDLADEFLHASGRLQVLCYKMDIEAALRTPGFAGFQLLGLQDFPGQGTALVGVTNAFWESKGYIEGAEYRSFCHSTVPLVRLPKMVFYNTEILKVPLEFAHFSTSPLKNAKINWILTDKAGKRIKQGTWIKDLLVGNSISIGNIECDLSVVQSPQCLTLTVEVEGKEIKNSWHVWVYPAEQEKIENKPYVTNVFNQKTIDKLDNGENVLLCIPRGALSLERGKDIQVGFSSIFWNTAWTGKQAPHTLGIYCRPEHPALSLFPTEKHSDFQWWDIVSDCNALVLDELPSNYRPIVYLIDDWFTNRKLSLLCEAKVGKGKLMICSTDLVETEKQAPVRKQFKQSILKYMSSTTFHPEMELSIQQVKRLLVSDTKK